MGAPSTAARREADKPSGPVRDVLVALLDPDIELGRAVGELRLPGLRVDGHEVDPVAVGRVQHGVDRGQPRRVDRAGRQAGVQERVVRGLHRELGLGQAEAGDVQRVQDGAVQLERNLSGLVVQPVVHGPGGLAVVLRVDLGFQEARFGDDLFHGELGLRRGRGQVDGVGWVMNIATMACSIWAGVVPGGKS